jgi:hypothetical protein
LARLYKKDKISLLIGMEGNSNNETENIPMKNGLIISIKISRETNGEIKLIENIIKKHIQKELLKVNERIRQANRNALVFTIIGMFLIVITQFYRIIEK